MKITIDIPIPLVGQNIINVPIHYCGGHVADAGGYGFEEEDVGKWVFIGYETEIDWEYGIKSYKCPFCDKKGDWRSPYCPNCGKKLEKEVDE